MGSAPRGRLAHAVGLLLTLGGLVGLSEAIQNLDETRLARRWVMRRTVLVDDTPGRPPMLVEDEDCLVQLAGNLGCLFSDASRGAWELRKGRKDGVGVVRIEVTSPEDKNEVNVYEAQLEPGKYSSTSVRWTEGRIYRSNLRTPFKKRECIGKFSMHPEGLPPIIDSECFRI